ncbi:hypothetical protein [Rufibacter roseus]|uniref:Uncharacterized protein n=1 Tax=Rufibacter roseus TaxID=1567108 RepID=A0ABW2DIS4_9BACT|nr:hypothetical protein [Rufibacter roseus]
MKTKQMTKSSTMLIHGYKMEKVLNYLKYLAGMGKLATYHVNLLTVIEPTLTSSASLSEKAKSKEYLGEVLTDLLHKYDFAVTLSERRKTIVGAL